MKTAIQHIIFTISIWLISISLAGQQCEIIYVTPNGASSGAAGTKANPANISYALSLVSATNDQIWLAEGTYNISNKLDLISDVTIEGGFDAATWQKSNGLTSIINRSNANVIPSPNSLVGLSANNLTNFRLQDIIVETDDATGTSTTTYALHISGSDNYVLCRSSFTSGNGTDGVDGTGGANGVDGTDGSQGGNGDEDGSCCNAGGSGAGPSYTNANTGGDGGLGGPQGSGNTFGGGTAPDGDPGNQGGGTNGGIGGIGGLGNCSNAGINCAGIANAGLPGDDGTDGQDGADGTNGTVAFQNYFMPGDGQDGLQGEHGGGGGGGGGGGSQGCTFTLFGNNNGAGPGGGGGGEGGEGGFGATLGTGGGGSFGAYIFNNGNASFIKDSYFQSGAPGYGGKGGFPGGNGGYGGVGALGHIIPCGGPFGQGDIGDSGNGGNGGKGGKGGNGGDGATGVSVQLYEHPSGIAASQTNMKSTVEPQIWVSNTGCTFSDIDITTNANGIVEWYFDGGSAPLNAVGSQVTVQYSNMTRHSITLVVNGVPYILTDYIGIFNDGTPYLPKVLSQDSMICPGTTASFSSSFAGNTYSWTVYDSLSTSNYTTSTINHTFNNLGTYLVTLQTTSDCCGKSKIDSFFVDVLPYLQTNVLTSASAFKICSGDSVSFGAMPINGGNDPSYQWQINGTNVPGTDSSIFTTTNLNNGDQVTCVMTSDYTCPLNQTATSAPLTIFVSLNPSVTCTNTSGYLGSNTQFTANGSGGTPTFQYQWDFGDGGVDTGATPIYTYGSTGTYNYSVTITDYNGCTSICNNTLNIQMAPSLYAGFRSDTIMLCGSTSVQFTDTSTGGASSWEWHFGDGNTDNIQNPSHTYNTPGTYTVKLIASNSYYNDTISAVNIIKVLSAPVAGITALQDTGCIPFNAQFIDASTNAASWQWDFGDPSSFYNSSNDQNPAHIYNDIGNYSVNLIVTSIDGCSENISMNIVVEDPPEVLLPMDTSICPSEPVNLSNIYPEMSNYKYTWSPGAGLSCTDCYSTKASPGSTTNYVLSVEAYKGCVAKDTISISSDTALCINSVYVPSAFSPNGDGVNDVLYVRGVRISEIAFRIFNRFGEMVFETNDINNGWYGMHKGADISPEVFIYYLNVTFLDGTTKTLKGNVTMVR